MGWYLSVKYILDLGFSFTCSSIFRLDHLQDLPPLPPPFPHFHGRGGSFLRQFVLCFLFHFPLSKVTVVSSIPSYQYPRSLDPSWWHHICIKTLKPTTGFPVVGNSGDTDQLENTNQYILTCIANPVQIQVPKTVPVETFLNPDSTRHADLLIYCEQFQ